MDVVCESRPMVLALPYRLALGGVSLAPFFQISPSYCFKVALHWSSQRMQETSPLMILPIVSVVHLAQPFTALYSPLADWDQLCPLYNQFNPDTGLMD